MTMTDGKPDIRFPKLDVEALREAFFGLKCALEKAGKQMTRFAEIERQSRRQRIQAMRDNRARSKAQGAADYQAWKTSKGLT